MSCQSAFLLINGRVAYSIIGLKVIIYINMLQPLRNCVHLRRQRPEQQDRAGQPVFRGNVPDSRRNPGAAPGERGRDGRQDHGGKLPGTAQVTPLRRADTHFCK